MKIVTVSGLKRALGAVFATIYPVGSIYMSLDSANPGAKFGGTWAAWGAGRVPLGVDGASYPDAGMTGGEAEHTLTAAEMPDHTHAQAGHFHTFPNGAGAFAIGGAAGDPVLTAGALGQGPWFAGTLKSLVNQTNDVAAVNQSAGGGQAHNNLPPYITCYMWVRTA